MLNFEGQKNINRSKEIEDILETGISKLKLVLFRHGPKKEAAGEKDELAEYFNQDVEEGLSDLDLNEADYVHISSSPADRAINTQELAEAKFVDKGKAKSINNQLGTFESLSPELKAELDILVQYQQKLEERFRADNQGTNENKDSQADLKNKIDSVILANMFDGTLDKLGKELNLNDKLNLTTDDFAHNLEEYTHGFLKHLNLLKSVDKKPASLNITHSYPIMSFLKNNLKFITDNKIELASNMKGEDFLNKVGGCVKEAQGITLEYIQKEDKKIIKVSNPDFTGYIDYE